MACEEHNHDEIIKKVQEKLPKDEILCDTADLFKVFGDTTRIKILFSLIDNELCVTAISTLIGMSQSSVSHQLKILKDYNLVGRRRDGKTNMYYLADDHVRTIIAQGLEHLLEEYDIEM